jgi:hypothetical protein
MKNIFTGITVIILSLFALQARAQDKLVINDRAQFLNSAIESTLIDRLSADSISLTDMIDNKRRCEYWFATLVIDKNNLLLTVTDCNDRIAGTRDMGSLVISAKDSEKAMLLYFALSEIFKKEHSQMDDTASAIQSEPGSQKDEAFLEPVSHHSSRYFFSPSSLNIKKGEFYYNSLYFIVHDVQYGISDQFSVGMGTTIFGFPFYITPKISIPVNERNSFAIGDMLILGTWGANFTGNLLYGTWTTGNIHNNFTMGGGYLVIGGGEINNRIQAPVINISGLVRMTDHMFFITENYLSPMSIKSTAIHYSYNEYQYIETTENFHRKAFFIYGLTGFRFINKARDLKSWQFGLSYIFSSFSKTPDMFMGPNWNVDNPGGRNLTAFPVVGFAKKFSTN